MVRNYIRKTEDRWSKEHLLAALIELKDKTIRVKDASKKYGISRATLYRNMEKFIAGGATLDPEQFKTCGGNPILTKVEEAVLEKTIKDLSDQGYEITPVDVKRICFEYCAANAIPNQFNQVKGVASDDWYYGFLRRHPNVAVTRKLGVGGRPRAVVKEEDKSESEAESEVIVEEPSKLNGKRPASGEKNVCRMSPSSSRLNADAVKEERGSPKLIAPDGMEVAPKNTNGAKRLKVDETWRSRRTRSKARVNQDNESENQHLDVSVVSGDDEGEEVQTERVELEIETNAYEAAE